MIRILTIFSLPTTPLAAADERSPHFVFILSDDIAQGDLGCYGQKIIKTPRLDEMVAEGTRRMQAYRGTSVCAPSRASFFTGLHSGNCPFRPGQIMITKFAPETLTADLGGEKLTFQPGCRALFRPQRKSDLAN